MLVALTGLAAAIGAIYKTTRDNKVNERNIELARAAAQDGKDDSYVNRMLKIMQAAQLSLEQENEHLRATVERQRKELEEVHRELAEVRAVLEATKHSLAICQNTCDTMLERVSQLENRKPPS